ncbi:hypothetical protein ACIRPK_20740 [Kitasatospora sp. NPDC101801]|uniref:hypothetical protein n=1 Tax=Kitasatospora sp. NPDC101801 TaxID=3364103 RepID=UPI0037F3AC5D
MTRPRPLVGVERTVANIQEFRLNGESEAMGKRGEKGVAENWLRTTRSEIAKQERAGHADVRLGFAMVCRLFLTAMQRRAAGEPKLWDDLQRYAQDVTQQFPPQ